MFKCSVILHKCRRSLAKEFQSCIFYFAKKLIENVKSLTHLGHSFTSAFNDDDDIINRRSNFVRHTIILCYFRKLHPFVQNRLFQAYWTSLYGCELWILTNCNIEDLCVAWRKTLRRIWNLPSCMHSRLLLGRSQIKIDTDERTQVHSAWYSLTVTHPNTNRGRRCLTSVNQPWSPPCIELEWCWINRAQYLDMMMSVPKNWSTSAERLSMVLPLLTYITFVNQQIK